jgi:hypothetical protein
MDAENRTTLIVSAILVLCFCIAVISIAAGGYFLLINRVRLNFGRKLLPSALPTAPSLTIPPSATCDDVQEYDDRVTITFVLGSNIRLTIPTADERLALGRPARMGNLYITPSSGAIGSQSGARRHRDSV